MKIQVLKPKEKQEPTVKLASVIAYKTGSYATEYYFLGRAGAEELNLFNLRTGGRWSFHVKADAHLMSRLKHNGIPFSELIGQDMFRLQADEWTLVEDATLQVKGVEFDGAE